ncbi:MAG: thioredoxin domain-containing protein [Candidatus Micrarchaeia archaeon]
MKEGEKTLEISKEMVVASIAVFLFGIVMGYYGVPLVLSATGQNSTNLENNTIACAMFSENQNKINEIASIFEDMYYVQTGTQHTVKYVKYNEEGDFAVLSFTVDGIYPQDVYITKDYKYLLQKPIEVSKIKEDVAIAKAQLKSGPSNEGNRKMSVEQLAGDARNMKGDPNAPVTIVEFSDFQCPYCTRFYRETYGQINENYIKTGKVKLVYRHFPLSFHENSEKAAEAAECAAEQGKFWEMHDKLFENNNALDINSLKKYAVDIGLDSQKFNECLDSGKTAEIVRKDFNDGTAAGVSGTPTFFVNGLSIVGAQPYSVFSNAIEQELQ